MPEGNPLRRVSLNPCLELREASLACAIEYGDKAKQACDLHFVAYKECMRTFKEQLRGKR